LGVLPVSPDVVDLATGHHPPLDVFGVLVHRFELGVPQLGAVLEPAVLEQVVRLLLLLLLTGGAGVEDREHGGDSRNPGPLHGHLRPAWSHAGGVGRRLPGRPSSQTGWPGASTPIGPYTLKELLLPSRACHADASPRPHSALGCPRPGRGTSPARSRIG